MSSLNPFLLSIGWSEFFQTSFENGQSDHREIAFAPARVVSQGRDSYRVLVKPELILEAVVTGKLHKLAKDGAGFPAVGDWVAITLSEGNRKAEIHRVLQRKSLVQRKRVVNKHQNQIIAANVDYLIIVTSLNEDFDLERLGRYIALGQESGVTPVLLLTKSDLCPHPQEYTAKIKSQFPDVKSFAISDRDTTSFDALQVFFSEGMASVLVGSSGVGKSTLCNFLIGVDAQKTSEVSTESRGKHTTTARSLLVTRWGGLVIDTPGMQEVAVVGEVVAEGFPDIEDLILKCKFTNCRHGADPGCAVVRALKDGSLDLKRWQNYKDQ
ncbi:MAG: ribosome small subunit-dependent GTPase A [Pseudobdellovibrio sp.]